jgi:hypothetical protein
MGTVRVCKKRLEELEEKWLAAEVDLVKERIAKGAESFEPLENVIKDLCLENETKTSS